MHIYIIKEHFCTLPNPILNFDCDSSCCSENGQEQGMSIIHDPKPQITLFHEENILKRGNGESSSPFCEFVIKTLFFN